MTEEAQGEAQQQGEQPAPPQQQSEQGGETPPAGAEWAQGQERAQSEGAEQEQKTSGDIAQEQGGESSETRETQGGGLKGDESQSAEGESTVAPLEGGEPEGATFAREQAERFEHPGQAEREAREKEEQQQG